MKKSQLLLGAACAVATVAGLTTWTQARQALAQSPPIPANPQERAQDNIPPAGSPFATLPGFRVDRVNPVEKTDSYIVVTFDDRGRPVVGQSTSGGPGNPRVLLDANNDGIYEGEKVLSDRLNTCHGIFFDGPIMYADCLGRLDGDPLPPPPAAGRGAAGAGPGGAAPGGGPAAGAPAPAAPAGGAGPAPAQAPGAAQAGGGGRGGGNALGIPGLYKLQDTNGDDVMDTIERVTRYTSGGMGDHGPHAIRRGPDGSIMIMLGNNTYFGAQPVNDDLIDKAATPNWNNMKERQFLPQMNDPRFGNSARIGVHAVLAQLRPGGKFAITYSGMRNPYDFAYNIAGEPFVFDSDMEWDVNAPWYREVRTFHMVYGGDAGYRNGTGKFQDDYFDITPSVRNLRRGSPVGVETYQSYAYPSKFFDNLLEADWSRGRLLYTALTPAGATYRGREDLGEFVHGEPMPITDVEVGPDGNVYFTTGGGAANGGLYKVTWTGARPAQPDMTGILAVVRQPQPLSSWAWANIERIKASMGASFGTELERLARNTSAAAADRARALYEMQRHGAPPSAALLTALVKDREAAVRSAVMFVAGVQASSDARTVAAAGLRDANPEVQRRAAEALIRLGMNPSQPSFAPIADIYALLGSSDQFVRYAGRLLLEKAPRSEWANRVMSDTNPISATEGLLALINTKTSEADLNPVFERLLVFMKRTNLTPGQKIRVLRAFQVAATETSKGVDPELRDQVHDALIGQFPTRESSSPAATYLACQFRHPGTTQAACDETMYAHHIAKVLAYTGQADVIDKIFAVMPKGDADQPGQIDYVYALRSVDNGWTPAQKKQLADWWGKASKWRGGSTFAGHLNNIFDATIDSFSDEDKKMAYAAAPLFAPLTEAEVQAAAQAAAAAAAAGRGGGGGGRGGNLPANARQVPINQQERYDNLVFPRGGGPGSLTGRGGAPDPKAGAQTFQQACASCHKFGAVGAGFGPDLTSIGKTMLRRDILRAIFFPDEKVDDKYLTTVVALRDGRSLRGLVVGETAQTLSLKTAETPEPMTLQKSDIAKRSTERTSIMPSDIIDKVGGDANIQNVVVYLLAGQ